MKCRWSHCKHGGEVDKSEAVQVGSAYYHKDCYTEKKSIEDIITVYTERVDPNPIIPAIRKVINDLIFNKGYDAEYLLYAVNYCLDHGWKLKYPGGLYYVAKNDDVKTGWARKNMAKVKRQVEQEMKSVNSEPPEFDLDNYKPSQSFVKKSGGSKFSRIIAAR